PKIAHHGVNTEMWSSGNVWSKGLQKAGTFDSHRAMSFDYIRTECVVANDKGSGPGGANDAGPFVGKRTVHWNVNIFIDPNYPLANTASNGGLYVYQPKQYSMGALVGIRGAAMNTTEGWAMPVGDKGVIVTDDNKIPTIVNLYEAQRNLRCASTSSNQYFENQQVFEVYPNPATGFLAFQGMKDYENMTIEIYDMLGRNISGQMKIIKDAQIDISGWDQGIYFYRISKEGSIIQAGKFIKK
nr:T9SS type A sorting domain-containing protein [Bacteroidota bacterium]